MKKETQKVVDKTVIKPIKKKQVEFNDSEIQFLNANHYEKGAWEALARRHSFDQDTVEYINKENARAILAIHKVWEPLPQEAAKGSGVIQKVDGFIKPIPAAAIRQEMMKRDLTKPSSDETYEETV